MLNQSPSPGSRVCLSWAPSLQFNECLYAESCNMSLSTSLPWHYSPCLSALEFMMFEPVICRRMAADWRDSGWQEFTAPGQCSAEVGFIVRSVLNARSECLSVLFRKLESKILPFLFSKLLPPIKMTLKQTDKRGKQHCKNIKYFSLFLMSSLVLLFLGEAQRGYIKCACSLSCALMRLMLVGKCGLGHHRNSDTFKGKKTWMN